MSYEGYLENGRVTVNMIRQGRLSEGFQNENEGGWSKKGKDAKNCGGDGEEESLGTMIGSEHI